MNSNPLLDSWIGQCRQPKVTMVHLAGGGSLAVSGFRLYLTDNSRSWWEARDAIGTGLNPSRHHGPVEQLVAVTEEP